jgi:glucan phosphoethanolaminetransferase (alkaline phosphatase superfamily)
LLMAENRQNIFIRIASNFRQMSWKQHLVYWILPLVVIGGFALGYFAGPRWVQDIIAPVINREFGLQEDIEHLLLLSIVVMTLLTLFKVKGVLLKLGFFVCFLGAVFMFLEEIDYGQHYINYFRGINYVDNPTNFNIHNQKKNTINNMMKVCYVLMGFFFVILPFLKPGKLPRWLQQLTPSPRIFFTVLVLPLVGQLPLVLNRMDFHPNNSLFDNLSEFEELGIYYTFLLYFVEMYRKARESTGSWQRAVGTAGRKIPY